MYDSLSDGRLSFCIIRKEHSKKSFDLFRTFGVVKTLYIVKGGFESKDGFKRTI